MPTPRDIFCIAPLFVVKDVPTTLAFYRDKLGFEVTFQGPEPSDVFFGIVERDAAMIMFKAVGVDAVPNRTRDIGQGIARWDAYVGVADPDALAAEFASRNVEFFLPLQDNHDNLRGFEIEDPDGYVLFFGRPNAVVTIRS
jgi:catechol 2,3-dioxygenase-like lactoylglutathione lyase family enzyme